ncbi:hypothetical protein [Pseudogemmobacter sp. W21_MBD1_M6]|uniref:hypothetical protein n=1 Tax=Pseudogemmobacter sp. W21_MBD1_M6 TaxID=3240271 RepID=UPI003F996C60
MTNGKTLRDLDVMARDVLSHPILQKKCTVSSVVAGGVIFDDGCGYSADTIGWSLVSRAEPEPKPEPIDLTAIKTPIGLLDEATQQALRDHGGPYQAYMYRGWEDAVPGWNSSIAYRVKPTPKVETVTLYFGHNISDDATTQRHKLDTHKITLTINDGVVDPVVTVEVLEALE